MISDALSAGVIDRLRLCSLLLNHVSHLEQQSTSTFSDDLARMQKGMFFVQVYAAVEFTVTSSFSKFLESISGEVSAPKHYKPALLSVLLDSNFKSLMDCSPKKRWRTKAEFLTKILGEEACSVDTTVFPSTAMNISHKELCDVWYFLGLDNLPLPEGVEPQLLAEIKDHRNAIAHGRECAHDIGARYSLEQLLKKHKKIELLCHHVITSIDDHYKNNFKVHAIEN